MKPEAQDALDNAKKYNINDPAIYLYEGDLLISQDKPGDAAGRYEQAIHFDPSCKEAYLKYANVYQGVQPALSIEMLQKVITNYPDYLPAYNHSAISIHCRVHIPRQWQSIKRIWPEDSTLSTT